MVINVICNYCENKTSNFHAFLVTFFTCVCIGLVQQKKRNA